MSYIFTTADERINFIRIKTARAYEHIQDVEKRIKSFLDSEPYKVGARPDPRFPNTVPKQLMQHYVASAKPITTDIPLVAGEALLQMRSALDHLAWNLVEIGCAKQSITLTTTEQKQIGFPIIDTDSPTEYEASRKRKVKGMTQAAIDAIDATKPYKGGNDCLWRLNQLNNIDKHRFIVFAGAQLANIGIPRALKRAMLGTVVEKKGIKVPPNVDLGRATLNLNIVPDRQFRKCPLEEGDELISGFSSFLEQDEELDFTFEIVFNEPGVVECEPMLPLLVQTLKYVNNLILSFKPLLI
jgi:hypothetical protein